jgi:hypothetical protein
VGSKGEEWFTRTCHLVLDSEVVDMMSAAMMSQGERTFKTFAFIKRVKSFMKQMSGQDVSCQDATISCNPHRP